MFHISRSGPEDRPMPFPGWSGRIAEAGQPVQHAAILSPPNADGAFATGSLVFFSVAWARASRLVIRAA